MNTNEAALILELASKFDELGDFPIRGFGTGSARVLREMLGEIQRLATENADLQRRLGDAEGRAALAERRAVEAEAKITDLRASLESAKPVAVVPKEMNRDQIREHIERHFEFGSMPEALVLAFEAGDCWVREQFQSIPADRVLGEGQVAVDREEGLRLLTAIEEWIIAHATGDEGIVNQKAQSVVVFRHALDALRSQVKQVEG